jgi:GNAT superfamily N-acetyltransferase
MDVAVAAESELETVLGIMDEAAAWLHSVGISEQWPRSFSADHGSVQEWKAFVAAGTVYLGKLDGAAMSSVVLEVHPFSHPVEPTWPDGALDAVLLYRLAVRRSVAGTGVAADLLAWAAGFTRQQGKQELRLDCWAGNTRLKRYYKEAGFEYRGDVDLTDSRGRAYSVSRFARPV